MLAFVVDLISSHADPTHTLSELNIWAPFRGLAPIFFVISPCLASPNVYLHYAYDLWVQRWRQTKANGDMIVVRFADDQIVGFEHEHEAKAFLHDLPLATPSSSPTPARCASPRAHGTAISPSR